jgi:hypothetical protein|tara:strand:- start:1 stop:147 length:147 start_codon:yes stop_codon:yes gene_type:complete
MKTYEAVVVIGGQRCPVSIQAPGAAQAKAMIESQYGKDSIRVHPYLKG